MSAGLKAILVGRASLLGDYVQVERKNGFKFKGIVEWLNKDGTFHVSDESSGAKIQVAHNEIKEVLPDETPQPLKYNGLYCSVCNEPQFFSDGGDVCKNGHGGAPGKKDQYDF